MQDYMISQNHIITAIIITESPLMGPHIINVGTLKENVNKQEN